MFTVIMLYLVLFTIYATVIEVLKPIPGSRDPGIENFVIPESRDWQNGPGLHSLVSIHGYFIVRQGGFQEDVFVVFYCETKRI